VAFAYFFPLNHIPLSVELEMEECVSVIVLQHIPLSFSRFAILAEACGYESIPPVLFLAVGSTLFVYL
jgi:hypothetical protein